MKKFFASVCAAVLAGSLLFVLQGCLKDSYSRSYTYTFYEPVYKTVAEVRANIRTNPARPVQKPGKIYLMGSYIFLNEVDKGIHIIDNSQPLQPRNIGFIDIPGNLDIAVKGHTLYADLYSDLVAVDISDPAHAVLKTVREGVFPRRSYNNGFSPDSTRIIVDWVRKDTTITDREKSSWYWNKDIFVMYTAGNANGSTASVSPIGIGGSMARFTLMGDRLYTLDESDLVVFNVSSPEQPVQTARQTIGWNIETIYPFLNRLFIGSMNGMYVYNVANPDNPVQEGIFNHVRTCDPVIADGSLAYVTLRSGTTCQGYTNQLDILDIANPASPQLLKTYTLSNPHGLSKDGDNLFICDGAAGLKLYNARNAQDLQLVKQVPGLQTYDVIAHNGIALVVAEDGLYQYDYANPSQLRQLSRIPVQKP